LAAFALIVSLACAWLLLRYATKVLGGVTGDVYGFTATLTETATLLAATMGEVLLWEG